MRKYIVFFLVTVICVWGMSVSFVVPTYAQSLSISQLIELLITTGVIAPDKATAARAAVSSFASVATTTAIRTNLPAISTSTSYFQVLAPNATKIEWNIDSDVARTISWGSAGTALANPALLLSNGKVCDLTSAPIPTKDGTNNFNILLKTAKCYNRTTGTSSAVIAGTYKARIYYTDSLGTTIKDDSDNNFKILPVAVPAITVVYPNGGESLIRGDEYTVRYTLKDFVNSSDGMIYLRLLDSAGNSVFNGRKSMRNGTYNLELPSSITPGAYKIKLYLTTSTRVDVEDTSNNFFWISSK